MAQPESYPDLVARLAALSDAFAAERARIDEWYERQVAAAREAVDRATEVTIEANAAVATARSIVERTDNEAGRLWRFLENRVGALGPSPEPAPYAAPQAAEPYEADPLARLRAVAGSLQGVPKARRALPSWLSPVLPLVGAAGGGIGYAAARAVGWLAADGDGDLGLAVDVATRVLTVLAPFVGLLPAKLLADRRDSRLDLGGAAVVVLSGLAVLGTLLLLPGG